MEEKYGQGGIAYPDVGEDYERDTVLRIHQSGRRDMSFLTIFGKTILSDRDRRKLEADLRAVKEYTAEVQEQERRKEEAKRAAAAREAARKAEEERLAIRREEQAKLDAALREAEEHWARIQQEQDRKAAGLPAEKKKKAASGTTKFSISNPVYDSEPSYSLVDSEMDTVVSKPGRYSVDTEAPVFHSEDLFGYNSPFGIDDILSDPAVSRTMHRDLTFAEKLVQLMQKYAMTSTEVYRAGNIDKSLFSKMLSNPNYSPSKDTAVSVALALKLSPEEAEDLLKRAGYTLSHSIPREIVLECFFKRKIFNVVEANIILDKLGHKPLSRINY